MKPAKANNQVTKDEARELGTRIGKELTTEEAMIEIDRMHPLLRQFINESRFEWCPRKFNTAFDAVKNSMPHLSDNAVASMCVMQAAEQEKRMFQVIEDKRNAKA